VRIKFSGIAINTSLRRLSILGGSIPFAAANIAVILRISSGVVVSSNEIPISPLSNSGNYILAFQLFLAHLLYRR
jgi:hypothetical protein